MQSCDTLSHNSLDLPSFCDTFEHRMRENVIHVRLDNEEFERATRLAARTKISVGALIRGLLLEADEESNRGRAVRPAGSIRVAKRRIGTVEGLAPADAPLDEPIYKTHSKGCACFLCESARKAGLI